VHTFPLTIDFILISNESVEFDMEREIVNSREILLVS
jgi:hypothetical protein